MSPDCEPDNHESARAQLTPGQHLGMRHVFVDWNSIADQLEFSRHVTAEERAGLAVGDQVIVGDGELDVPGEVTAVSETGVTVRIAAWSAESHRPSAAARSTHHPPVDVISVRVVDGTTLELGFGDGAARTRDVGPLLRGRVFQPMRDDPTVFAQVSVDADSGTIAWPNGADISPELLRYDDLWALGPARPPKLRDEHPASAPDTTSCACRRRHPSTITRIAANGNEVTVQAEECDDCAT